MHKKYAGNYCHTVQFKQKTTRYVDDLVTDTSYWYEWIQYPDKFRIDFTTQYGGNCVIFKHDSVFNYKKHQLVKAGADENDLLLLLGGMYFRQVEQVMARLKKAGYALDKLASVSLNGIECYVIGEKDAHQIWVDKKDLKVVGLNTKLNETDWLELHFDAFQKSCKGFTETKVSAKKNGKLEQVEEYLNIKTEVAIPDSIFNKK